MLNPCLLTFTIYLLWLGIKYCSIEILKCRKAIPKACHTLDQTRRGKRFCLTATVGTRKALSVMRAHILHQSRRYTLNRRYQSKGEGDQNVISSTVTIRQSALRMCERVVFTSITWISGNSRSISRCTSHILVSSGILFTIRMSQCMMCSLSFYLYPTL